MKSRNDCRPSACLAACFGLCLLLLALVPVTGFSEEIYQYKRMWPNLPQPWYFNQISAVAIDKQGNLLVADTYYHRIQKFTSNGKFITN